MKYFVCQMKNGKVTFVLAQTGQFVIAQIIQKNIGGVILTKEQYEIAGQYCDSLGNEFYRLHGEMIL